MHDYAIQTTQATAAQAYPTVLLHAASCLPGNENDHAFIKMLESYRSSGGLARAQEVFTLFKSRNSQSVIELAHWMAQRTVLSLEWHGGVWVPLFQFEREHMTVKSALGPVFAALNPACTPWELAQWCSRPHPLLNGLSPADALDTDAPLVLRAACADRFTPL